MDFVLTWLICRQGLAPGTTTCANCTAGFYCVAGSLNVYGGTNITGTVTNSLLCLERVSSSLSVLMVAFILISTRFVFPSAIFLGFLSAPGAENLRFSTLAGSGVAGVANGVGAAATFNTPFGVVLDSSGVAYIGDQGNDRVRQIIVSTGAVTTLAGSGTVASTDGTGTSAAFSGARYAGLDGLGNLYVTDTGTHRIRKVVLATRAVTTVAGTIVGAANGVGASASFSGPRGIACDASGNAYIADYGNHLIRKMVLSSATVTTLAGSATASAANGVGISAGFSTPINLVVDSSSTLLFVVDHGNNMIRQIVIATQAVTTLAGSGTLGSADGVGTVAQFSGPQGLALDASGNLFVSDTVSDRIRLIVIATQVVTTLDGTGDAGFISPTGLSVARGFLIVADRENHRIRVLQPTAPCTPGYYCAQGADRALCSPGFYCPAGSSSATQVACPAGPYVCPAGASAPVSACGVGCAHLGSLFRLYPAAYF
jgi:sugar lactone lactonase YvrE